MDNATVATHGTPGLVSSLYDLAVQGGRFRTIYADPPWRYANRATRSAVEHEYKSTMSVDEICDEPVRHLVMDDAHLHLWTTNAFLFEARRVMEAWGFRYKSCLVWVKPQMGIGNYWRVSHEFLLLGIRGRLPFASKSEKSWLMADRTKHSRKPRIVREAIERVSPGPYLELYGREALPPPWTVYGNEIERSLFDEHECIRQEPGS
jgi:N6-adenosine-specific RNA methylase IME4